MSEEAAHSLFNKRLLLSVTKEEDQQNKSSHITNSSASGIPTDQSFMTVIQQAGMGGVKNNESVSHFDEIITNFVSKQVRKFCHRLTTKHHQKNTDSKGLPELTPTANDSFAAVVMVDVSGYSKLTAALAERGPVGAELLSKTMKGYLDQIIEVIVRNGGDIVKFAGDAVIVYWKSETAINMQDSSEDIERGELVYKASHCCLELLTKLGTYDINIADCATKTLRIHLGIGAGLVADVVVGGFPGRWEHFIAGDGVNQLSQVLDLAKAGELALSHQALKWLVYVVDIRTLNLGDYDKRCIILTGLAKAERRVPAPVEQAEVLMPGYNQQKEDDMTLYKNFMDRTALFKLQADVNQSNLFQLDSGLLELLNLTELRQITTIFIKIGSLQGVSRDELLGQSQDAIQVVQHALQRCDGSLRQFHVDDKGAVILCFFGLPPLAHENDSKLGISAGIEIREKFADMFEEFSIGITTGVVSFGGVGFNGRAEYAVMGDAINMAARLMCHKEAKRGILCDEKTYNLCENEYQFENLGETTVKGKNNAISIFRPVFSIPEAEKNNPANQGLLSSGVIGREAEKRAVSTVIEQLSNAATVDNLLFNAEGGQGLTTLANHAKAEAVKQGCYFCTGKGVQIEQNNAFFVFRNIVCDLINLFDIGNKNSQGIFKLPGNSLVNVPVEAKIKEKPKLKLDSALEAKEGDQVPSTPVSARMADRKMSRRTSTIGKDIHKDPKDQQDHSPEAVSPNGNIARRQSYSIQESPVETNEEEMFTLKFKMVMDKLECNENQAALLKLVTNSHEDESDAIAQAHLRLHAKDLCDILTRMLNTITEHNKIILMITEVQYIDTLSWDLLLELAVNCPRLAIFSFGRPESTFESKENRRIYRLIEQLPRTQSLSLNGLTQEETITLIMCTWNGHFISGVDPKIAESIFKRTDGNPFFIRSLVMALKESGQWRVSPSGQLTTPDPNFDFDKLVLGYDNQSIVLAQFDRLDRNFQLFLKVASVLGMKFALDDVLYFLTGFADASQHIDRKKYNQIISGLQATDKYQFLQKESVGPDGGYFQFKSALVKKCIYSMMVHNQRQQIHLLVARYLESKMNEQNRHRYVVQVLDHYMNTGASHKLKRIYYTEMAANYFFEKETPSETIKYCKQLLELIGDSKPEELAEVSNLQIANFHRELGYALMMKDELDEAEEQLIKSLEIMGHTLPASGYKFNWALKAQISKRKKLDKTFFKDRPVPQEEDYTQSYVARKGASGYSLSNLVAGPTAVKLQEDAKDSSGNVLPKQLGVSPAQQIIRDTRESLLSATQHALVTLATVFLKKGNFDGHYYAILLGLNISTEKSIEGHMSKLFALGALALKHLKNCEPSLPAQYMDASITYDLRIDIHTSLQQVVSNANLLFLGGQLEACQNKLEVVSYLSTMAGDLTSRVYGLNLKCFLQTHSVPRETALNTAKDLYTLSTQREMQVGKIWGCYHIIHNLLGDPNAQSEILQKLEELQSEWKNFSEKDSLSALSMEIAKECITLLVPVYVRKAPQPDWKSAYEKMNSLVAKVAFHQWHCFAGLVPLALTIYNGLKTNEFTDPALLKVIDLLCDTCNKAIKSIKGLQLNGPIRRIFKGLKLLAKKKQKAAMKAWQKGIEEQSEDIYTQSILHSAIAGTGEDRDGSAEKAEDLIRDIKCKQRFNAIFPPE